MRFICFWQRPTWNWIYFFHLIKIIYTTTINYNIGKYRTENTCVYTVTARIATYNIPYYNNRNNNWVSPRWSIEFILKYKGSMKETCR